MWRTIILIHTFLILYVFFCEIEENINLGERCFTIFVKDMTIIEQHQNKPDSYIYR